MTPQLQPDSGTGVVKGAVLALKPALLWTGVLVCAVVGFHTLAVSQPRPWSTWDWISYLAGVAGLILPFAAFAAGVRLTRARTRRTLLAVLAGLIAGFASYTLSEFVSPLAEYAEAAEDAELAESWRFGPRTPVGKLRQLRFVEANPPEEYRVGDSVRTPPNRVRLLLHSPAALAAFALINTLLGVLAAGMTGALPPPARRNARFAIGLVGGVALFAIMYHAAHPERDWVNVSGVAAAWLPLALPCAEALIFAAMIRHREGAFAALAGRGAYRTLIHGVTDP